MSEPKHGAAGSLKGSAAILAAIGGVIRGTSGRLEPGRGALLRLGRTPPVVAAQVALFLAAGVMGSFTPGVQAQETEECDHVWFGSATVKAGADSGNDVGYKPGTDYPGSTLDATTFTYDGVEYTVGSFVNNTSNGSVEISLSPTPTESAKSALTLYVGSVELPFSSGTSTGGLVTWLPSALGLSDFSFADGESIRLLITESAAD